MREDEEMGGFAMWSWKALLTHARWVVVLMAMAVASTATAQPREKPFYIAIAFSHNLWGYAGAPGEKVAMREAFEKCEKQRQHYRTIGRILPMHGDCYGRFVTDEWETTCFMVLESKSVDRLPLVIYQAGEERVVGQSAHFLASRRGMSYAKPGGTDWPAALATRICAKDGRAVVSRFDPLLLSRDADRYLP